jgi:hypothetical protein
MKNRSKGVVIAKSKCPKSNRYFNEEQSCDRNGDMRKDLEPERSFFAGTPTTLREEGISKVN